MPLPIPQTLTARLKVVPSADYSGETTRASSAGQPRAAVPTTTHFHPGEFFSAFLTQLYIGQPMFLAMFTSRSISKIAKRWKKCFPSSLRRQADAPHASTSSFRRAEINVR